MRNYGYLFTTISIAGIAIMTTGCKDAAKERASDCSALETADEKYKAAAEKYKETYIDPESVAALKKSITRTEKALREVEDSERVIDDDTELLKAVQTARKALPPFGGSDIPNHGEAVENYETFAKGFEEVAALCKGGD